MRIIDADELYKEFTDNNYMCSKETVRRAIKDAPTIETITEPLVRCKDCWVGKSPNTATCQMRRILGDNGYCSIGTTQLPKKAGGAI